MPRISPESHLPNWRPVARANVMPLAVQIGDPDPDHHLARGRLEARALEAGAVEPEAITRTNHASIEAAIMDMMRIARSLPRCSRIAAMCARPSPMPNGSITAPMMSPSTMKASTRRQKPP